MSAMVSPTCELLPDSSFLKCIELYLQVRLYLYFQFQESFIINCFILPQINLTSSFVIVILIGSINIRLNKASVFGRDWLNLSF